MAKKAYVGAGEKYAVLEYIESTGTQYIDTGIMANTVSAATVDFQLTSVGTTEVEVFSAYVGNASRLQCGWAGSAFMTAGGFSYSQTASAADRTVGTSTGPVGSPALSVYLFGQHEGTTVKWLSSARLYSCGVSVGGELSRQFVPAKRQSDGAVGLYDTVEGRFYVNDGTGTFIPGPETGEVISTPPAARSVKKIYVGVDGVARKIKKGYVGVDGIARQFWQGHDLNLRGVANAENPRGAAFTIDMDSPTPSVTVRGGTGTGWSHVYIKICDGDEEAVLPAGTPITLHATATNVTYGDATITVYAADGSGALWNKTFESSGSVTATITPEKDFRVFIMAEIGGLNSTSIYSTLTINKLVIGGTTLV